LETQKTELLASLMAPLEAPGVCGSTELNPGAAKGGRAKHMTPLLKPIVRKTDRPFMHYRTPLVVTLLPGDVISLRLLRHKREVVFNLHTLYYQGLRAQVAAEKRQAP
jgi:hypothetical protein